MVAIPPLQPSQHHHPLPSSSRRLPTCPSAHLILSSLALVHMSLPLETQQIPQVAAPFPILLV